MNIKYIAKKKDRNTFKVFSSISEIEETIFRDNELYAVSEVSPQQFQQELKNAEIQELKQRLASLGVDLNSLTNKQPTIQSTQEVSPKHVIMEEPTTELSDVQEDVVVDPNTGVEIGRVTAESLNNKTTEIVNKTTGQPFTMGQLRTEYDKFKLYVEEKIPEVIFSSFDEKGFAITVTEVRRDLPRILPNGIPLRQIVS